MAVVGKYKTKSKVPAKGASKSKPKVNRRKPKGKQVNLRQMIRSEVNKTREIKRLWGVQTEADNTFTTPSGDFIPTHIFSEGTTAYTSTTLNITRQGLENENRIGNIIQPLRFTYKGYAYIEDNTLDNVAIGQCHVRLAVGLRRQASPLSIVQSNLMMEGGKTVNLGGTYQDILNPFNWKEFRPFYDKTFQIAPRSQLTNNFTNPNLKNYFHFNVDYKFGEGKELVALEDEFGSTFNLYNNDNIYVVFICRQMQNGGQASEADCKVLATSLFQFHDA